MIYNYLVNNSTPSNKPVDDPQGLISVILMGLSADA
jgi:hypothetical protein